MSNRQRLEKAVECFGNPPRRSEYFELYSDDVVLHGYQGIEPGRQRIVRFYEEFWSVFPEGRIAIEDLVEEGNTLAVRYVIYGSQQKTFMSVPAVGQAIKLPGISFLHFRDGRCFERWTCSDSLVLADPASQSKNNVLTAAQQQCVRVYTISGDQQA